MSMCKVCGGLIAATNQNLGYSGPICNGLHHQYGSLPYSPPGYLELRVTELEERVFELTQQLAQRLPQTGGQDER